MSVFINEFHYDNAGGDVGEFIEIAAPAGFDLTGWSITLYNGSNGGSYNTIDLSPFTVVDAGAGVGFVTVSLPTNGLQNGSPDGMALVNTTGAVVEFLSYEGIVMATDGPAVGLTSTDVGVSEPGDTPVGQSLQRQGTGSEAGDFVFAGPLGATPGAVNEGQSFGAVAPVLPSLVINEVLADPGASVAVGDANGDGTRDATQDEFIEIVNTGDTEADLSGMTISDGFGLRHTFAEGTTLAAGAALVVFGGGTPTGDFGGAQVFTASTGALGLNNTGDSVTLATVDGDTIAEFAYGSEGSSDQSLTRDPDSTGAYVLHTDAIGAAGTVFSPGTQVNGDAFLAPVAATPVLAINEINADPASDLTGDANGDGTRDATQDEFVEIVNTGGFDADLFGVTISDGFGLRHTFAEGTTLAAGAALVVFGGGTPTGDFGGAQVFTASSGALGLNNGSDSVTVAAADGTLITEVSYGSEGGNNQSLTRDPDISGSFVQHTDATGAAGALFSPGTQADGTDFVAADPVFTINEVDSDTPGADTAEFIELYDGGVGNASLDGLFVALFNGSNDTAYDTIVLDGLTTDENGFFVIGSADVPNVDLVAFTSDGLQNGADAVALYSGSPADLVDGLPTITNLIDAVVYDTNDADDTGLLTALGLTVQYNEDANGLKDTQSNSRNPDGSGDFVAQDATPGETNVVEVDPPEPVVTFIHNIQGSSAGVTKVGLDDGSALEGQVVTIEAIVTAEFLTGGLNGFFVQEEDADTDADVSTSEGLFVSTFSTTAPEGLAVGDLVSVTGTVDEFFGETRVVATNIGVISSDNDLPSVTFVDLGAMGAIETDNDDLDYVTNIEAYEGMLVQFTNALTISEMFNLDRFGQYSVSADGRPTQFTQDNAPDVAGFAAHQQEVAAKSIVLDDGLTEQNPDALQILDGNNGVLDANDSFRMGDTLEAVTGVVAYGFDEFRIHDPEGTYSQTNARPETPEDVGGTFKVASLNVLNFFTTLDNNANVTDTGDEPRGADDLTRFDDGSELANTVPDAEYQRQLIKAVAAITEIDADVLGLVEVENTLDSRAIETLVDAVNDALGSEVYGFINTGIVGGDAITNGIIYKIDSVNLVGDHAILEEFNGRDFVDPLDAGRGLNRPAVAQTFEDVESGELITVAVNHLKSKGSLSGLDADEAQGDGQGNNNATRTEAVDILAEWLASDPTNTGAVNQMILGDLNAYAQEDPLTTLEAAGFTNVASDTDYSFVFDGQIGTLDYILINEALADNFEAATEWHINADEPDAIDYNLDFGRDPDLFNGDSAARNSDHDPIIAGFTFEAPPEPNLVLGTEGRDKLIGTDGDDEIRSLAGSLDQMTGGDGADTFVFGAETSNGVRERDIIMDYEVGIDTILIEGDVSIASVRELSSSVVLYLDGDRDAIYVRGEGVTADNLNILFTDDFALA